MSLLGQTLILYLLLGVGVAGAVYLGDSDGPARWLRVATAIPFWPLYVPLLLARGRDVSPDQENPGFEPPPDELDAAIGRVEAELEIALASLGGWADDVLTPDRGRIGELRTAWRQQAERIREMDLLLAVAEEADRAEGICTDPHFGPRISGNDRLRQSLHIRRQNLDKLRSIRQRAHDDLTGTLAWVRELVSMIHLAKFTGAPAARARELVAQIAAAVEGLSGLTPTNDSPAAVDDSISSPA
jgi:hypothetical protein